MQQPRNLLFCSVLLINALHYATGLGVSISGHVKVGDTVGDFLKKLLANVEGQSDPYEEYGLRENKQTGLDLDELQKWLNRKGDNKVAVVNKFGYGDYPEDMLREMNDQPGLSAGHVYGIHDGEDQDEPQNVIETRL